ncbi:hypothetical protein [Corallococcus exiguus]|uniref:hypothetical protein n=1 Tax=Corallococcus exiguus TaxID=83462 RepID=UPI001494D872|nr:hypothetical protein [Corallococcus exiguus]NPD25629.1 hypothetical protein [Corallococcus exiguus]
MMNERQRQVILASLLVNAHRHSQLRRSLWPYSAWDEHSEDPLGLHSLSGLNTADPFNMHSSLFGIYDESATRRRRTDSNDTLLALCLAGLLFLCLYAVAAIGLKTGAFSTDRLALSVLKGFGGGIFLSWLLFGELPSRVRSGIRTHTSKIQSNIKTRASAAVVFLRSPATDQTRAAIINFIEAIEACVPRRMAGDEFAMLPLEINRLIERRVPVWQIAIRTTGELTIIAFNAAKLFALGIIAAIKAWNSLDD